MNKLFRRSDDTRGQALVEFALIIPIFLFLMMGVFDLGRVVWAHDSVASAAREATRYAIVHGGSQSTLCPAGPMATGVTAPGASVNCPNPSPSKQAIIDVAEQHLIAAGGDVEIQVCYGADCSGNTNTLNATNARGTPVTVTIRSTVTLSAGGLIGMSDFDVTTSSTMIVSH